MSVKAGQILALLDNIAPFALAEEWDNVGLLAGSRETEVETVLCALDLTEKVLDEALEIGAQMIVTHHPILFRARRNLCADDAEGRLLVRLAGSGAFAPIYLHNRGKNAILLRRRLCFRLNPLNKEAFIWIANSIPSWAL